jgi:hypothetical protein
MESREILQITIELPEGCNDVIVVHEADEPADLAALFCKKHKLDSKNLETLTNLIEQNIDLLIEAEKSSGTAKLQLVKQAVVLPSRKRQTSPLLISQAKKIHESLNKSNNRRPTSAAPTQKKNLEKDNINRYGIKTPTKAPKVAQKHYYDKLDQYFTLFELLNPNPDGKINASSLSIPALPENMMQVISPLLNELKTTHKTIGFSDFTQAMDKIINNLETGEKALLLETNHKKDYGIPNAKSGKMNLYDRQMLLRHKNEEKLKEKRQLKESEELRECKFQPQIKNLFKYK